MSFSVLHLYDPAGFRKVGLRERDGEREGEKERAHDAVVQVAVVCGGFGACRMMQHASLPRVRQSGT